MRKCFAFWFVVGLALVSSGQDAAQPQQEVGDKQVALQREYNEHDARMWTLGASAVLIERNHGRHTTLAPAQMNERNIANEKKLLSEWWGAESTTRPFRYISPDGRGDAPKQHRQMGRTRRRPR